MFQYLVFVGAAINLVGKIFYIKETLKGSVKPNRVSWLLWSFPPLIAAFASISAGAGLVALPIFMAGFTPLLVFSASFVNKKAYWRLKKFDYLCGFFSLLAVIFWSITKEPITAVIFSLVGDGFASIPTIKKVWHYPETERGYAYITAIIGALSGFSVVKTWNFSSCGFLFYLVLINGIIIYSIYRKRLFKK